MSEIKVGEYVRTRQGYIAKLDEIGEDFMKFDNMIYCDYEETPLLHLNDKYGGHIQIQEILKHSPNIIDLIEDEDFVILEYKSPKYRERIKRIFEVSKIGEYISFENVHCSFQCKVGDKKINDDICKNVKIKSIVTHEQFQNMEYRLED